MPSARDTVESNFHLLLAGNSYLRHPNCHSLCLLDLPLIRSSNTSWCTRAQLYNERQHNSEDSGGWWVSCGDSQRTVLAEIKGESNRSYWYVSSHYAFLS